MAELMSRAAELARRTEARRPAPVGEEFTGPVLVEGQASGELLRQTLVPLVLARRAPDGDAPRFAQNQGPTTPFLARIGLRVLSDSFSVTDTPSLQGVRRTSCRRRVRRGRRRSTGERCDARRQGTSADAADEPDATEEPAAVERARPERQRAARRVAGAQHAGDPGLGAQDEVPRTAQGAGQAFGYIVRAIAGPGEVAGGQGGPIIVDAVKVTPDGTEEPVRGLRFGDVPSTAFRDILEASEELHAAQLPDQRRSPRRR